MTDLILKPNNDIELSNFNLKKTGLEITGNPTYEEWEQAGTVLKRMEGAVQWWLGDWLNFGESAYGEKYSQAVTETGKDYGTLRNTAYVAGKVKMSLRNDNLNWSHHVEVANLSEDNQKYYLDLAAERDLNVRELRSIIKNELGDIQEKDLDILETEHECPKCGYQW